MATASALSSTTAFLLFRVSWALITASFVCVCNSCAAPSSFSACSRAYWAAVTFACASATMALYSSFVSASACCEKNRGANARKITNISLWVLLILSLLVGSAQQDYYTTTLY